MKKIKVLGHEYRVVADPEINEKYDAGGLAFISQNEIRYDPNYSLSQIREVLLHECLEIVNSSLDLDLSHQTIQSLSCAVQQLFADNPQLVSLFKKRRMKRKDVLDREGTRSLKNDAPERDQYQGHGEGPTSNGGLSAFENEFVGLAPDPD